jgi:hypothetical protein
VEGLAEVSALNPAGSLRREARLIGLLFASTTSIIGAGWLFGTYHASRIAGPLEHLELGGRRRHHHDDCCASPSGRRFFRAVARSCT